jgi:hypothetical protein
VASEVWAAAIFPKTRLLKKKPGWPMPRRPSPPKKPGFEEKAGLADKEPSDMAAAIVDLGENQDLHFRFDDCIPSDDLP